MHTGPHRDHLFHVTLPRRRGAGWGWTVTSARGMRLHGPWSTREQAANARRRLLWRWQHAARARGGWMWCQTAVRWVVTLPADQPTDGLPFEHAP